MYKIHLNENIKVEEVNLNNILIIFSGVNELIVRMHVVTIYIIIQ